MEITGINSYLNQQLLLKEGNYSHGRSFIEGNYSYLISETNQYI
jgi:hypothetical protein